MNRQDDTLPIDPRRIGDPTGTPASSHLESDSTLDREVDDAEPQRLELTEERLVVDKEDRQVGEAVIRKVGEEFPGRVEVDADRDDVEVEHVPVGQVVREREEPRQEGDVLVVPIYEEQVVAVKRLVLREYVRVRRYRTTEKQVFTDTLRRDRLVVEDPDNTGQIRETYSEPADSVEAGESRAVEQSDRDGLIERVVKRVLS